MSAWSCIDVSCNAPAVEHFACRLSTAYIYLLLVLSVEWADALQELRGLPSDADADV